MYKLRTHTCFDLEHERALILSCSSCETSYPSSWQYMFDVGFFIWCCLSWCDLYESTKCCQINELIQADQSRVCCSAFSIGIYFQNTWNRGLGAHFDAVFFTGLQLVFAYTKILKHWQNIALCAHANKWFEKKRLTVMQQARICVFPIHVTC